MVKSTFLGCHKCLAYSRMTCIKTRVFSVYFLEMCQFSCDLRTRIFYLLRVCLGLFSSSSCVSFYLARLWCGYLMVMHYVKEGSRDVVVDGSWRIEKTSPVRFGWNLKMEDFDIFMFWKDDVCMGVPSRCNSISEQTSKYGKDGIFYNAFKHIKTYF